MSEIKPSIDDQFWFDRSSEMVKGSIDRFDKWADRIRDVILWAIPVYTASSIFTVEYKKISEWWIIAILVVPYLFLFLAYLDSQLIQKPFSVEFDYRSPDQIKNVYIESYNEKLKVMKTLSILSIVSIVSLSFALITAFVIKNNQKESPKEDVYISGIVEKEKNKNLLVLTSKFPKQSLLRVQIAQQFYDSSQKKLIIKDSSFPILNSQSGILQQNLEIDTNISVLAYRVTWKDTDYTKTLQKTFNLKAGTIN